VIGGHGFEGPWIKPINLLTMGLSMRRQCDGVCYPQANESWCIEVMNPCLERAKWEPSQAGRGIAYLHAIEVSVNNGKSSRSCT
jgi:hypothetical protein